MIPSRNNPTSPINQKSFFLLEVLIMKSIVNVLVVLAACTLISLLATGCAQKSHAVNPNPATTTQPCCPTTQPAQKTTCSKTVCTKNTTALTDETDCETEPQLCQERHPMTKQNDRMIHNAELSDMVLCDIHFMPNRPMLNANGTQRLNHLAWLVDCYGGTIKLDLAETKGRLTDARTQTVIAYLKAWGLSDNKIQVRVGLADTKGMDAKEAIPIYKDTRYQPQAESGSNNGGKKSASGNYGK